VTLPVLTLGIGMLRASRFIAGSARASSGRDREEAKQAVAGQARYARDTEGTARACTSLLREPLPCELGAVSGEEMSEDKEHWFIDSLVWGPYQDALGQEVFLASVSGLDDFGSEVNGILWEQQRADIPSKIVHMYMENLPVGVPEWEQPPS